MPEMGGRGHSSAIRKTFLYHKGSSRQSTVWICSCTWVSAGHHKSAAHPPSLPLVFDCVLIKRWRGFRKWRMRTTASTSSSPVHSKRHPFLPPLPSVAHLLTPPSTPPEQTHIRKWKCSPLLSRSSSSAQLLSPSSHSTKEKKEKGKKVPIWEIETVLESLEDDLDGSVFFEKWQIHCEIHLAGKDLDASWYCLLDVISHSLYCTACLCSHSMLWVGLPWTADHG